MKKVLISDLLYNPRNRVIEVEDAKQMWALNPFCKEKLTDAHVYHNHYPVYATVEAMRLVFSRKPPEDSVICHFDTFDLTH